MADDYDDEIDRFNERVPDDVHPNDVADFMRGRYSRDTIPDSFIDEVADGIADRRRSQGQIPDDPRDVDVESERGRGVTVGQITFDSEANRWRDKETGNFVSSDDL